MSGKFYATAKQAGKQVLKSFPPVFELAKKFEEHAKGMVVPGTLFEEFGFNYIGPIDGHDLDSLIPTLQNLKQLGEQLAARSFCTSSRKRARATNSPKPIRCCITARPSSIPVSGSRRPPRANRATRRSSAIGCATWQRLDSRLVGITPAMREGSGLVRFEQEYPDRYFDVGIAEQHAVTFAAGLACDGMKPVVAIYSTFLQRAYDQLIHDVAFRICPSCSRSIEVGWSAPTARHITARSICQYLRCLPNMIVMAASEENECRQMFYTAFKHDGPAAVRYPRGTGPGVAIEQQMSGAADRARRSAPQLERGRRVVALRFSRSARWCRPRLQPPSSSMRPWPTCASSSRWTMSWLRSLARTHDALVTIEENVIAGGAGSACLESLGGTAHRNPGAAAGPA